MPALTVKRVGHKGADRLVPGNTLASFDAARAAGVDMIEFDVLPALGADGRPDVGRGRLMVAHDAGDLAAGGAPTLDEGLAHLASPAFAGVELDVDLKLPGYERRVVEALRRHGLLERSLISTTYRENLARIRALEPRARLGWSVPRARRDYTASALWRVPAHAALRLLRRRLPGRAAAAVRAGRCDAVMAHWRLVTPRLVGAVAEAGGELYVWTVDDAARIRALAALGVTGIVTNDPRLFA